MAEYSELMKLANSNLLSAQYYFEQKYSFKRFIFKNMNFCENKVDFQGETVIIYGLKMALQTLQKFGCKIVLLTVDFTEIIEDFCDYLESSVNEYCTSSLFHLKIIHASVNSKLTKIAFTNLQTLELQWSSITDENFNFNSSFPNLRRLIFTKWNNINQNNLRIQFLALQELQTTMYIPPNLQHFNISMDTFMAIKTLNPNLSTSILAANIL